MVPLCLWTVLLKTSYKKYETSRQLGLGIKTFYGKLKKYNLCLQFKKPDENKKEQIIFKAGMTLLASKKLKVDYKTLWGKSKKHKIDNKIMGLST